jgi:hypothetical protein
MDASQIAKAVSTRARVRISERNGWAAGVEGIALGFRNLYGSIKVGFVDANGDYTGEYTVVSHESVELVEEATAGEVSAPSGIARILADLKGLNDEVAATLTTPANITDTDGRIWTWWQGDLYRNSRSAIPRALIDAA